MMNESLHVQGVSSLYWSIPMEHLYSPAHRPSGTLLWAGHALHTGHKGGDRSEARTRQLGLKESSSH